MRTKYHPLPEIAKIGILMIGLTSCAVLDYSPFEALPSPTMIPITSTAGKPQADLEQKTMVADLSSCRVIAPEALNLRAGPGTDYSVLAWLRSGELLTRTNKAPSGSWIEVSTQSAAIGWINSIYCKRIKP